MSVIKHFLDLVKVSRIEKGQDRYYTAICPVCGNSEQSTVENSEEIAKNSARDKVLAHAKRKHKDLELEE
jgi:NMD protein affecting ribosome stability and mRNA decay